MTNGLEKSLAELTSSSKMVEGATHESPLSKDVSELWTKPLGLYSNGELRLMIGQKIGLDFLIPMAIDRLVDNPFVKADLYFGDLLSSILKTPDRFWVTHPEYYWLVLEVIHGLPLLLQNLTASIERLIDLEATVRSDADQPIKGTS